MFLADLLDLKEHKESKTGFKWRKADFMGYHTGELFHIVDLDAQHGMRTQNNDFKGKEKDGL